jgi:hypothetical protein
LARDNFNPTVIRKLKDRVAMRCSNPSCRVPTSAATTNVEKVNNIGIAAHICAASKGGPRFNERMTPTERISITNAIWLCSNCSIEIDRDVEKYTVTELNEWKKTAEATAQNELGKKLPSKTEALDTLSTALTGYPKSFISTAISNIHSASSKTLEQLDPRLSINTAYQDGVTTFKINAKENFSIFLKPQNIKENEYKQKISDLIKHGRDIEFSSGSFSLEGSKFFDETINKNNGNIRISKSRIAATQKISLIQNKTNLIETFDDINGYISFGTDSFTFKGTTFGNLLGFEYQKLINDNTLSANFNFQLQLDSWNNLAINTLPYFEKIRSFFSKITDGWTLATSLEINGEKILGGTGIDASNEDFFLDNNTHFDYIHSARVISNFLKISIKYKSTVTYTIDDFLRTKNIAKTIEGKETYKEDAFSKNITCNFNIINDNVDAIKMLFNPCLIQFKENIGEEIKIIDTTMQLPPKIVYLNNVVARIGDEIKVTNLKIGDVIKVEWIPQENFLCSVLYETL